MSGSVDFVRDAIVEAAKRVCGGDASVKTLGNARYCEISVLGDGMTVIAVCRCCGLPVRLSGRSGIR